jgi:predicted RNA-binding protein with PIN domain
MHIIIDGYNLLKQVVSAGHITEKERSAFVNLLGRYKSKRGHKISIVFDAGPTDKILKEKQRGIEVIYSGEYCSADDVIVAYVKEHSTKEILVITADREIIGHVKKGNVEVADPQLFYQKVKAAFEKSEAALARDQVEIIKTTEHHNPDLDALMQEAAHMQVPLKDMENEYTIPEYHQPKRKMLSKKKIKQLKKIDKL